MGISAAHLMFRIEKEDDSGCSLLPGATKYLEVEMVHLLPSLINALLSLLNADSLKLLFKIRNSICKATRAPTGLKAEAKCPRPAEFWSVGRDNFYFQKYETGNT